MSQFYLCIYCVSVIDGIKPDDHEDSYAKIDLYSEASSVLRVQLDIILILNEMIFWAVWSPTYLMSTFYVESFSKRKEFH